VPQRSQVRTPQTCRGAVRPDGENKVGLRLTTAQEVLDLIADLRTALRRSQRTGGSHAVYRLDEGRKPLLLVEVHVPFYEQQSARDARGPCVAHNKE